MPMKAQDLFADVYRALAEDDTDSKLQLTHQVRANWLAGLYSFDNSLVGHQVENPGRPARPELVKPRYLSKRSINTPEGHAALIHAICHIEFNAINLALDAVYRFRELPGGFYGDWLQVADEESAHFKMLREHLQTLGYDYGDFPAHNGLWEMAQKTAHDPMVRMALVPRVLEARGLDVTPGIVEKLRAIDDQSAIAILDVIFRDEIGHVAIGSRWFNYICQQRSLDSELVFQQLIGQYMKGQVKGPFHKQARQQGGFSDAEMAYLEGIG
jgi:uncharacterized ferritin-like protein (DUF455 family)